MANGFDGSIEAWERMEAPLLEIDEPLAQFVSGRNMEVIKNYHNWPQRQIDWSSNGIYRSLCILLANEKTMTFHMAAVASKDENGERYLKDYWLRKGVSWDEVRDNLHQLLEDGITLLESWSEKDLIPSEQFKAQQRSHEP